MTPAAVSTWPKVGEIVALKKHNGAYKVKEVGAGVLLVGADGCEFEKPAEELRPARDGEVVKFQDAAVDADLATAAGEPFDTGDDE